MCISVECHVHKFMTPILNFNNSLTLAPRASVWTGSRPAASALGASPRWLPLPLEASSLRSENPRVLCICNIPLLCDKICLHKSL